MIQFHSYLWLNKTLHILIYHVFLKPIDRHQGRLYSMAIMNRAAINMDVQVPLWYVD